MFLTPHDRYAYRYDVYLDGEHVKPLCADDVAGLALMPITHPGGKTIPWALCRPREDGRLVCGETVLPEDVTEWQDVACVWKRGRVEFRVGPSREIDADDVGIWRRADG
jgi:hypothetical protein